MRTSTEEPATSVPSEVRTRYNSNGVVHGTTPVNAVAFRSLPQALAFINGRSPVTRDLLTIDLIGDSDADQIGCSHTSLRPLLIRGTTEDRTDSRAFIGGQLFGGYEAGKLTLQDCTINATGTIADPARKTGTVYCTYVNNGLELRNVTLTINSTSWRAMAITYNYGNVPADRAYCRMIFGGNYPTTIELDTSTIGNYPGKGGYADNIFGDLQISSAQGTNYAQNNLIWRASSADPAASQHWNISRGRCLVSIGGFAPTSEEPGSFDSYGNWDLKWTFDYAKTAANKFLLSGFPDDLTLTTSAIDFRSRSNLDIVINRGAINTYAGFQIDSTRTFLTIIDNYQKQVTPTMSTLIASAWAAAGTADVDAISVPLYNTYNGAFVTVGGTEIAPLSTYVLPDNDDPIEFE